MAMAVAALKRKEVGRIILTRPVVEAGESLGFLPGTLTEKVDPYIRPLYDALFEMCIRDRPWPSHSGHGFSTERPVPLQVLHVVAVCMSPRNVCLSLIHISVTVNDVWL